MVPKLGSWRHDSSQGCRAHASTSSAQRWMGGWMNGWMDTQTPAPGWCGGDKCPVLGQQGFSATHQLEQALLPSLPSHPHHRRKGRQIKISSWVPSIGPDCVVPSSTRFPLCPPPSLSPQEGCWPHRTHQGISQGPFLTRASSLLCFCVSVFAASSCSWDSDKSCLNCRRGTERKRKKSFYVHGFGTLSRGSFFMMQHLPKEVTVSLHADLPAQTETAMEQVCLT